jgi:predicted amidohydrolase YtcJ
MAISGSRKVAEAVAAAAPDGHGWIRGVGYAETVAGDLDAAALDRLRPDRPVRVQHRSGALWILNTAALRSGTLPQRVQLLGVPLGGAAPGDDGGPGPVTGPYKIVLAGSGLPAYDELTNRIRAAHAAGRPVAAHCVTREAPVLLLAVLHETGPLPGDLIVLRAPLAHAPGEPDPVRAVLAGGRPILTVD